MTTIQTDPRTSEQIAMDEQLAAGDWNGIEFETLMTEEAARELLNQENNSAALALNLVMIRCSDLELSRRFYQTLGLNMVKERHGSGPEHYAGQVGGLTLEIYPCEGNTSTGDFVRLGFRVPSLDVTLNHLQKIPAIVVKKPASSQWGRRAVISDPDGHRVELVEANSTP